MKHLIAVVFILFFIIPSSAQEEVNEKATTIYFIRHAEKDRSDKTNRDPHLKQKGLLRAVKWSTVLEHIQFDRIYSTNYNRTLETARPTAERNDIDVISMYDPRDIDGQSFLETNKGKTVLVVGHSNTTPAFVNAILGEEKYPQINDKNNANLYIVTISPSGEKSDMLIVVN
ncbi:MAG: histidine phosphatase family protein [Bacteroidia bacterium]|nr:histidine phosphatase family protein [Bacteroidia bacterium]NND26809.1 histidine phosphatase family protein [Flavobacteriaceae bacterium]MBT8278121.1 histidine phosphatase family protein [Bacteroidia bacterium]NNK61357.1 histidine phosphatase family protein [Flavobacteriaceae bacterium]NNL33713.1 histidine phosphatase family protein [Flavobacteriaceae bacterium]